MIHFRGGEEENNRERKRERERERERERGGGEAGKKQRIKKKWREP